MSNKTSINLTKQQKEILRKAAAMFGLRYQTYLKSVAIEHAKKVLSKKNPSINNLMEIPDRPRMEIITNDPR